MLCRRFKLCFILYIKIETYESNKASPKNYIYNLQEVNTEEDTESSSDYMGETSDDEDSGGGSQSGASIKPGVDLNIGSTLKRILEQDYDLITNKNKVS